LIDRLPNGLIARWPEAEGTDLYDPYRWIFARVWTDFDWYVAACERMRFAGAPPELTVALDVHWAFGGSTLIGELYLFDEPMAGDNHIGYRGPRGGFKNTLRLANRNHGQHRARETRTQTVARDAALIGFGLS